MGWKDYLMNVWFSWSIKWFIYSGDGDHAVCRRNSYKCSNHGAHMIGKLKYVLFMAVLLTSLSALPTPDTFITVDRGCGSTYFAGESILITYRIAAEPTDTVIVTLKEILPDSTMHVLLSNKDTEPGLMYSLRIFAQPLYGRETILMEYVIKSGTKSAWYATECSFYIREGTYETGTLKIECNQPDFDIFIDDAFVAHSPTETVYIESVVGGGHTVTVKKSGCKDVTKPVTITPGKTVTVTVEFDCTINDRDGDTVPDEQDQCYNPLCDLVDEAGCPLDSDGDGVADCEDVCPGESGDRESRGCPYGDADSDGVPDNLDECSDAECSIVDETGCPKDSDSDGITDCDDDCPNEPGDKKHFGCPERDSDSDGVIDDDDRCYNPECPDVDDKGCPLDSDADTIPDCTDDCPHESGARENNGCPEQEEAGVNGVFLVLLGIVVVWRLRLHQ
jgi:hypothetical protein